MKIEGFTRLTNKAANLFGVIYYAVEATFLPGTKVGFALGRVVDVRDPDTLYDIPITFFIIAA